MIDTRLSVLVVDDEPENVALLTRVLRKTYQVDATNSALEALEKLKIRPYDIIISDQRMPGMNGSQLLAESFKLAPNAIRIIVSAYSDFEASLQAINLANVSGFLHKPVTGKQLETAIATATDMRALSLRNAHLVVQLQTRTAELEEANRRLSVTVEERTREIQRSEQQLQLLVDGLPDGVAVTSQDRFILVNPAWLALTGHNNVSELIGHAHLDHVHPDDRQRLASYLDSIKHGEDLGYPLAEVRLQRADKSAVQVELAFTPITLEDQLAVVWIARDVTIRKELQARLIQAERMGALGRLGSGIGHEINNPLTSVIAGVDFVRGRLGGGGSRSTESQPRPPLWNGDQSMDEILQVLDEVRDGAERIRQTVRALQTLTQSPQDEIDAVDINDVLRSILSVSENMLRKHAELVTNLGPAPKVDALTADLAQVFQNILCNAVQAMPPEISGERIIRVCTTTDEETGYAVIEISDSGEGIAPEQLSRVFEPFYTTRDVGEGTGLGLSICQSLVKALGGEIKIQSKLEQGTTVTVLLPPSVRHSPPSQKVVAEVAASPRGRLLIVDDEPPLITAFTRMLKPEYEIVAVTSAHAALDELAKDDRFDVILCDLMMPGMSGMDFYEHLAKTRPDLTQRMVFMTAGVFTLHAQRFVDAIDRGCRETRDVSGYDLS